MGIDEVGRGCIAGPVCAGVVIFNSQSKAKIENYVDSKLISATQRELLSAEIQSEHLWALGWASVEEVDQLNIRQASLLAMSRAFNQLSQLKQSDLKDCIVLVDGKDTVPHIVSSAQYSVVKGDQIVRQISAASIIAKVARDQLMQNISLEHPEYGFEKHKGYGTEEHRNAIKKFGVTSYHRKTFAGVKEFI